MDNDGHYLNLGEVEVFGNLPTTTTTTTTTTATTTTTTTTTTIATTTTTTMTSAAPILGMIGTVIKIPFLHIVN